MHGKKCGPRETGRKSVYTVVLRPTAKQITFLGRLNAVLTHEDERGHWFRVPVRGERTVNDVGRVLYSRGLPCYWGTGREMRSALSLAPIKPVDLRKRSNEREKYLLPAQLLALFSSDDIRAIESTPEEVPTDWPYPGNLWIQLSKRYPLFSRAYLYCYGRIEAAQLALLDGSASDVVSVNCAVHQSILFSRWIESHLPNWTQ